MVDASKVAGGLTQEAQIEGWLYGVDRGQDVLGLEAYAAEAHGISVGGRGWQWGNDPASWIAGDKLYVDDDLSPRAAANEIFNRLSGLAKGGGGDYNAFSLARALEDHGELRGAATTRSNRRWAGETAGAFRDDLALNVVQAGVGKGISVAAGVAFAAWKNLKLHQIHHVISNKNAATKGHDLLKLAGNFDLESSVNKLYLPINGNGTRSIHLGRHWQSVSDRLAQQMDAVVAAGRAAGWSQSQYLAALRAIIVQERQLLRSGQRALNSISRAGAR